MGVNGRIGLLEGVLMCSQGEGEIGGRRKPGDRDQEGVGWGYAFISIFFGTAPLKTMIMSLLFLLGLYFSVSHTHGLTYKYSSCVCV